jgi:hypothetical protein
MLISSTTATFTAKHNPLSLQVVAIIWGLSGLLAIKVLNSVNADT